MNEHTIGILILAVCGVLYAATASSPIIRKAKFVDFSKVLR